ncbi:MAG: tyrosine--tRNA ligase, partial [Rhodopirellula sp. JB053]
MSQSPSTNATPPAIVDLLGELRWRGLLNQTTDEEGLEKLLASGMQTIYIGFDPTATSLHVGGMMQLMMLRRFQRAGHRPIALVGGATGMIGDPSGKSEERNLLSAEQLQKNVEGVAAQMRRFLSFDGEDGFEGENGALLLNNFDWMKGYSYLEFLRDVGKNFPVGTMMGKESVRSRLNSEAGLSYTQFSYMLLQAYDFVHLD